MRPRRDSLQFYLWKKLKGWAGPPEGWHKVNKKVSCVFVHHDWPEWKLSFKKSSETLSNRANTSGRKSSQSVENQMKIPILRKGLSEHVKGQKDKEEELEEKKTKRQGLWRIKLTVINGKKYSQSSFRPCVLTSQRHRQIQSWHVSLCGDRLL